MMKERLAQSWRNAGVADEKVIKAFLEVSREQFVSEAFKEDAYTDYPLPIACGKTISQPTTVIIMTNALELRPGEKVLEVGTGSGYQSVIIAKLAGLNGSVITTEVVPELVRTARENIEKAGTANVRVVEEDGSQGYMKEAPYDKIIVTAACPKIPDTLIQQLKPGGILVAPEGELNRQQMIKLRKTEAGIKKEILGEFVFTPMLGKHGFREEEMEL